MSCSWSKPWHTLKLPFVEAARVLTLKPNTDERCTYPEFKRAAE